MPDDDSATVASRDFYATDGPICDPGAAAPLLDGAPTSIEDLVGVVQGLMLHLNWASQYGVALDEERRRETRLRTVPRILARLVELDDRPLTEPRPPERRLVATCRDISVLLCALLHRQGVPARARCGFGTYFREDHFDDHWVTEVWHAGQRRWLLVDGQLDRFQREALGVTFDPLDVPHDRFLVAGRAWQAVQAGTAFPDQFGIFDMQGEAFIACGVVRDFLALNKIEILPWDDWGLMPTDLDQVPEADQPIFDELAELTVTPDRSWSRIRTMFTSEPRLARPPDWLSAT